MARPTNLTERGLDTQRELSEAMIELCLEKGFSSVTIKDITDRLGMDRTTFYLHFKDKDELVLATQRRIFDELSSDFGPGMDTGKGLAFFFERLASDRRTWTAILKFEEYPRFAGRFAEYVGGSLPLFLKGIDRAENASRLPRQLVARFVTSTVRSCALWWLEQPSPCSPAEIADMTNTFLVKGLG
jgi:AcrR family transcriptional regulator